MAGPIDLTTVAIIFVAALVAIGLTVWMLNRAWGDFPSRAGLPPAAPPRPPSPESLAAPEADDFDPSDPGLPAGASPANLVEVTHPFVLRAVRQALERPGSPYATYFIADGERVFLVLSRIADPAQRETARRLFTGLNTGEVGEPGAGDLMQMLRELGKR